MKSILLLFVLTTNIAAAPAGRSGIYTTQKKRDDGKKKT